MNHDGPSVPGPPPEGAPDPSSEPTEHLELASTAPDATVAKANRLSRRTMVAALAALLVFGSCGVAYGVFRATRGDGGGTVVTTASPGPSSPGPSASASASPTAVAGVDLVVTELGGSGVSVRNVGTQPVGRFVVSVEGRAFIVEGLLPGEIATIGFGCRRGPLTALVDSTGGVQETDETNNSLTAGPFDCASPTASPSASPSQSVSPSPTVSPTAELKQPDLVIRQVTSQAIVVANVGEAAAGTFVVDAGKAGSFTVGGLQDGASHTVSFPCTEGSITATADASGRIDESNEGNNSRTGGPFECLADLVVTAIGVDSVTIENRGIGGAGPSVLGINGQTFNVPAIAAGGKVSVGYACFGGQIQAIADLLDDVVESNEGNNGLQVDVGPCP